jgi:putative DNA primase/helicase
LSPTTSAYAKIVGTSIATATIALSAVVVVRTLQCRSLRTKPIRSIGVFPKYARRFGAVNGLQGARQNHDGARSKTRRRRRRTCGHRAGGQAGSEAPPNADAAARELAKLDDLAYDQCREEEAKRFGVRVKTLDDAVRRYRGEDEAQATSLQFPVVEPCTTPVDGAGLLDDLAARLRRHVILPDHGAEAVALWIVFAWAFDALTIAPMIRISAPERACGKSRLLEVIGALVPKRLPTASTSTAAMFRVIEAHGPTVLVDETENFLTENRELIGVINSGYSRSQAYALRCTGDNHDVKAFRVWAPKVLCGIGELSDTLSSRCIIIRMVRKRTDEKVERLRADRLGWATALQSRCARWAADHIGHLREADADMPEALDDRAQDFWRPLIALADLVGGVWPARARDATVAMSAPRAAEKMSQGVRLLRDIRQVFDKSQVKAIAPEKLVKALSKIPESPWSGFGIGSGITARRVASLLADYEIQSQRNRDGRYSARRDFEDAWVRYCPARPLESVTTDTSDTPLK